MSFSKQPANTPTPVPHHASPASPAALSSYLDHLYIIQRETLALLTLIDHAPSKPHLFTARREIETAIELVKADLR